VLETNQHVLIAHLITTSPSIPRIPPNRPSIRNYYFSQHTHKNPKVNSHSALPKPQLNLLPHSQNHLHPLTLNTYHMKSHTSLLLSILLLTISTFFTANGSYFYLLDTEPSCFLEDVPEDTAILVKYANLDLEQLGMGLGDQQQIARIVVTDPNSRNVVIQDCSKKGQVAFTSRISGDYKICVDILHSPRQGRQYKFGLKVASASETQDYSALAKQEHFSAIVVEMTKINDRIQQQKQELLYLRSIEEKIRDETENVHDRVLYFFLGQTVIIVGAMLFQIFKLRRFFKAKQLVN